VEHSSYSPFTCGECGLQDRLISTSAAVHSSMKSSCEELGLRLRDLQQRTRTRHIAALVAEGTAHLRYARRPEARGDSHKFKRRHHMDGCGVRATAPSALTSVTDGDESSASRTGHFTSQYPLYKSLGRFQGRTGHCEVQKDLPVRESTPGLPSHSPSPYPLLPV
jgi:hypothetical protein